MCSNRHLYIYIGGGICASTKMATSLSLNRWLKTNWAVDLHILPLAIVQERKGGPLPMGIKIYSSILSSMSTSHSLDVP